MRSSFRFVSSDAPSRTNSKVGARRKHRLRDEQVSFEERLADTDTETALDKRLLKNYKVLREEILAAREESLEQQRTISQQAHAIKNLMAIVEKLKSSNPQESPLLGRAGSSSSQVTTEVSELREALAEEKELSLSLEEENNVLRNHLVTLVAEYKNLRATVTQVGFQVSQENDPFSDQDVTGMIEENKSIRERLFQTEKENAERIKELTKSNIDLSEKQRNLETENSMLEEKLKSYKEKYKELGSKFEKTLELVRQERAKEGKGKYPESKVTRVKEQSQSDSELKRAVGLKVFAAKVGIGELSKCIGEMREILTGDVKKFTEGWFHELQKLPSIVRVHDNAGTTLEKYREKVAGRIEFTNRKIVEKMSSSELFASFGISEKMQRKPVFRLGNSKETDEVMEGVSELEKNVVLLVNFFPAFFKKLQTLESKSETRIQEVQERLLAVAEAQKSILSLQIRPKDQNVLVPLSSKTLPQTLGSSFFDKTQEFSSGVFKRSRSKNSTEKDLSSVESPKNPENSFQRESLETRYPRFRDLPSSERKPPEKGYVSLNPTEREPYLEQTRPPIQEITLRNLNRESRTELDYPESVDSEELEELMMKAGKPPRFPLYKEEAIPNSLNTAPKSTRDSFEKRREFLERMREEAIRETETSQRNLLGVINALDETKMELLRGMVGKDVRRQDLPQKDIQVVANLSTIKSRVKRN